MKITLIIISNILMLHSLVAQESIISMNIQGQNIHFNYHSDNAKIGYKIDQPEDGISITTVTLSSNVLFQPKELSIKWSVPSNNIAGYWGSSASLNKTITPNWGPAKVTSMLARHAPVICLYGFDDTNQQTFAISEALNTIITSTAIKEENGMIYNEIKLFTENHKKVKSYTFQFRLDSRPIHFSKTIAHVAEWWTSFDLYQPAFVPEEAKLPVYSSWYSYHQNVSKEELVKECKLAKAMGYESIIVDDGWQTMDSNRGYAFTGDWNPDRIPDMKEFVKAVHDLDMKFILWYAVPFVGEKSKAYEKLKGKFLTYWEGQGTYVVDPRFPEVREFIIGTYVDAINKWNLDGFKLDFLGRFKADDDTPLVADGGRDYASVNEATDRLMTDLMDSLRKLKPEILIEFRQPYTGPAMRKYGNMLRATDCPNVAIMNRVSTTDLRLLSGNTAVHADMLMWHYDDPVEVASLQLLNILYSVPQMSVQLDAIPEDHFEMIRFYTNYWIENRDILLEGEFIPSYPQMNYPIITGRNDDKQITTIFNDSFVSIDVDDHSLFDIINAKLTERVVLDVKGNNRKYQVRIFNCLGEKVSDDTIELIGGNVNAFNVPHSGMITFTSMQ